ncbi:MAG: hypothetical protein LUO93_08940 [Methanomicrobiales archaeon]|nr:hypothetical protein [Methanomicrobiales archaeon]
MSDDKRTRKTGINEVMVALEPVAPYDFFLSTRLFSSAHFSAQDPYREVLRLKGIPALVTVTATGSVDQPGLCLKVLARHPLTSEEVNAVKMLMGSMLNVSLELSPFYRTIQNDPILGRITKHLRGLKPRKTPTVFEALVRAITEQQISLVAAHHIQERLIQAFGERLSLGGENFFVFPTPERLARTTEEELRDCGLSRNKASYIIRIARSIADVSYNLENLVERAAIRYHSVHSNRNTGNRSVDRRDDHVTGDREIRGISCG